jgi:hypothetical protein
MELQVHGTGGDNILTSLNDQMVRQPSGFFGDAPGLLEAVKPIPA